MSTETSSPAPEWSAIPFYRKALFNTVAMLFFVPASLLAMWTGPVYRRRKGVVQKIGRAEKITFSVLGVFVFCFWLARLGGEQDPNLAKGELPLCASPTATRMLKTVVGNSVAGKRGLSLDDILEAHALSDDEMEYYRVAAAVTGGTINAESRFCVADALTNAGRKSFQYQLNWKDKGSRSYFMEATWQ